MKKQLKPVFIVPMIIVMWGTSTLIKADEVDQAAGILKACGIRVKNIAVSLKF